MDRRALLAILISTFLIILYQVVFLPSPEERLAEEQAATESAGQEAPAVGGAGAPEPAPGIGEPALPEAAIDQEEELEARRISVSTPLLSAELDTRGGVIRSIELLRFEGREEGPVELIGEDAPGGLGLIVTTAGGEIDLRHVVFNASSERITLRGPEEEATLRLEKSLAAGVRVVREFVFHSDVYRIDVRQTIERDAAGPEVFSYRLLWEPGIAFTEEDPTQEKREMSAVTALGDKVIRDRAGKVDAEEGLLRTGGVRWTAVKNKYFAVALVPEDETEADVRIHRMGEEERVYLEVKFAVREPGPAELDFAVYAGPLEMDLLKAEGRGLEGMIDLGWSWIRPISRLTLAVMVFLYKYVPNYGVVIILISLITKLLFYRLTHKSMKSMKDMQKIQGRVAALKEKYKGDPQRLNKETWALYKKEGVNPMSGCFPMLLQMPVFVALYQVLQRTIALRKAAFVGWIDDLSQPDVLAQLPASLPFLGDNLSLLPLLMGASMILQQKMTTVDPRQKAMVYLMPIFFTVLFYRLPSGLVLYWLVNNLLSIGQQYLIHRGDGKKESKEETPAPETRAEDSSGKKRGKRRRDSLPAKETS
jgi:YidC/Oxa1 family membrane protein insertase